LFICCGHLSLYVSGQSLDAIEVFLVDVRRLNPHIELAVHKGKQLQDADRVNDLALKKGLIVLQRLAIIARNQLGNDEIPDACLNLCLCHHHCWVDCGHYRIELAFVQ
jgi:hypothetical protein